MTTAEEKPDLRKRPHWFRVTFYECPVCGRGGQYREYVVGEKPPDEHPHFEDQYDQCIERESIGVY
jgi:hypothetical protein